MEELRKVWGGKIAAFQHGWSESDVTSAIASVNRIWDDYCKKNKAMVAPMLKGMPKRAKDYFVAFFKKNSHGHTHYDNDYCDQILGLMGVSESDADIFFTMEIMPNY